MLDNYDSFTYNLVHAVEKITGNKVDVFRNDKISVADAGSYDKINLSPGPGVPGEAGILEELIRLLGPSNSILGVCLGLQAIGEVYGGKLVNLNRVFHGIDTRVIRTGVDESLFDGLPGSFDAGRYHSWIVGNEGLPSCLSVTMRDEAGEIMALRHNEYDVRGVQFHPESVLTPNGEQILRNWLAK